MNAVRPVIPIAPKKWDRCPSAKAGSTCKRVMTTMVLPNFFFFLKMRCCLHAGPAAAPPHLIQDTPFHDSVCLPGPVERGDHVPLGAGAAAACLHDTDSSAVNALRQLPWSQVFSARVFIHSASLQSQEGGTQVRHGNGKRQMHGCPL